MKGNKKKKKNEIQKKINKAYRNGFKEGEKSTIRMISHEVLKKNKIVKKKFSDIINFLDKKGLLKSKIMFPNDYDIELVHDSDFKATVSDSLISINENLLRIEEVITQTKKSILLQINDADFVRTNISQLIESYCIAKQNEYQYNFQIQLKIEPDIYLPVIEALIKGVIDNFLNNSQSHAFTEWREENEVLIELFYGVPDWQEEVTWRLSNNGKKFTSSFDKFITKGEYGKTSKGYGLGGYYMNEVAKIHEIHFDIFKDSNGFAVEYYWSSTAGVGQG